MWFEQEYEQEDQPLFILSPEVLWDLLIFLKHTIKVGTPEERMQQVLIIWKDLRLLGHRRLLEGHIQLWAG